MVLIWPRINILSYIVVQNEYLKNERTKERTMKKENAIAFAVKSYSHAHMSFITWTIDNKIPKKTSSPRINHIPYSIFHFLYDMMQMKEIKTSNIQILRRKLHMNENNATTDADEMMKEKQMNTEHWMGCNRQLPVQLNSKKASLKYRWLNGLCGRVFHLKYGIENCLSDNVSQMVFTSGYKIQDNLLITFIQLNSTEWKKKKNTLSYFNFLILYTLHYI